MKNFSTILLSLLLSIGISSCISSPLQGALFTNTSQHIYGKTVGNQVGAGKVLRRGESCSWSALLLADIFYGAGYSMTEAMEAEQIHKVAVVDYRSIAILGGVIFHMECIEVYGE